MIDLEIKKFFKNDKLNKIPKKHDYKQKVLFFFYNLFENKEYSEKEVNEIIKIYYDDFSTIRRYLIDYKFLIRNEKGSIYIKNLNKEV